MKMLVSILCFLLLAVAAYVLIKTKPNLFLLDLMNEVFGDGRGDHHHEKCDEKSQSKKTVTVVTSQQNQGRIEP